MVSSTASNAVLASAARSVSVRCRIAEHVVNTPLLRSCAVLPDNTELYFKTENFQTTGSFKLRGATAKLTSLPLDRPLITASSGNHGIACSHAARITGHKLTVVLPETVAPAKLAKIKGFGTAVILHGAESGLAETHAQALAASGDYVYVSPYNDAEVIAGQGSIGLELLEQLAHIDNVFIAMGGGGLISGIGSVLKAFHPGCRIIGVSASNSAALAASIAAGHVVETEHLDTLADGIAGGVDEDAITLELATEVIDRVVHCDEEEIVAALRALAWTEKQIVEGAAGLALAGYLADQQEYAGQVNVVLLCGANFDKAALMEAIVG
ncbi:MAG: pyridoxal-phosphate dependent enzyme [Pseudomonadota bacterium]